MLVLCTAARICRAFFVCNWNGRGLWSCQCWLRPRADSVRKRMWWPWWRRSAVPWEPTCSVHTTRTRLAHHNTRRRSTRTSRIALSVFLIKSCFNYDCCIKINLSFSFTKMSFHSIKLYNSRTIWNNFEKTKEFGNRLKWQDAHVHRRAKSCGVCDGFLNEILFYHGFFTHAAII
jgi:hypothetical protein